MYKLPAPLPGLSILPLPPEDVSALAATGPAQGQQVCATCGYVPTPTDHAGGHCRRCEATNWVPAVLAEAAKK